MKQMNLIGDMMDIALHIDRFEQMYQVGSDKKPVVEFYFEEIADLAKTEAKILSSIDRSIMGHDYEKVQGHGEFSDCREYTVGPIVFRLRCDKLAATKNGKRLGVRDIIFNHLRYP